MKRDKTSTNLGKVLLELKKERHETFTGMAKKLNVNRMSFWRSCYGQTTIPVGLQNKVAEVYDLSEEWHNRLNEAIFEDILSATVCDFKERLKRYLSPRTRK